MISNYTVNVAPRPGESRLTLANNKKFKTTFGWEPTTKLEDWIRDND
jgi:GDP-D-mannose dehydratase